MSAPAPTPNGRLVRLWVLTLTVLVFGVVVAVVTQLLRTRLREQIVQHDAVTLAGLAAMQLSDAASQIPAGVTLEEVPGAVFVAVLKTSKYPGVLAVRVFDRERQLSNTFGLPFSDDRVAADVWQRIEKGEARAQLHLNVAREPNLEVPLTSPSNSLVEAWVPLRGGAAGAPLGAAQFWVDGKQLVEELGRHDERLWIQAGVAWLAGALVILVGWRWAFRRIDAINAELRARSEDLQRANRELVLAAKTSALGAVAAHLMHEIKNPLAGLEVIVAGQGDMSREGQPGGELAAASELTRRLRTMVNDVVGVLRDEQSGADFELTGNEIAELALEKVRAEAARRSVDLQRDLRAERGLPSRRGNLATLVLRNLLQNALEATPAGGRVSLRASVNDGGAVSFTVEDQGPGLPDAVRARLFQPCSSTKVGGSGLGLALSHQLAQQAGGRIELVKSDAGGTTFRLVLAGEA
jgi:signal transduction histidine kinase